MNKDIEKSSKKQITFGAVLSYVSIAVNILAGLLYTPWMIRTIGKSDYSLFTLAHSLITMFLVDFGLSSATGRFVSVYRAKGEEHKINQFLGAVYKLYILVDFVIMIILTVIFFRISSIYVKLSPEEIYRLKIVFVISAAYSLISFPFVTLNGILTAYEKFIYIKLGDLIYRFLIVGLMVIALLNGFGLYALVIVNAVAGLSVIAYKLYIIKRQTNIKVDFRYRDKSLVKQIFGFSVWVTISVFAQRLIFNITPSILGIVASSGAIAVFGIVITIEGYVYMLTSAIGGMFMPKVSRMDIEEDSNKKVTDLLIKVGRFQYGLTGLVISGFFVIGYSFIKLWMGDDYLDAYTGILLVLIPGVFFNSLEIANTTLIVRNKVKLQSIITVIVGVVNVALSFVLSRFYGVIGASASIFVAYMIRVALYVYIDWKALHLDMKRFIKDCYLKMLPPILITCLLGYAINSVVNTNSWVMLMAVGLAVCIIYILSVAFISLNKNERKSLFSLAKSVIKR